MDKHRKLILLIGPPRGGTTIVARSIAQHPKVDAVLEPYQRRREDRYDVTDPERLATDFGIESSGRICLMVKETFTRKENVYHCIELIRNAIQSGMACSIVMVARSPIEGFLSQVKAVDEIWSKMTNFSFNQQSAMKYLRGMTLGFTRLGDAHLACESVETLYDTFCENPRDELQRIMGSVGLGFNPIQLKLKPAAQFSGGDPTAFRSTAIKMSSNNTNIDQFKAALGDTPAGKQMILLHQAIKECAARAKETGEHHAFINDIFEPVREALFKNVKL